MTRYSNYLDLFYHNQINYHNNHLSYLDNHLNYHKNIVNYHKNHVNYLNSLLNYRNCRVNYHNNFLNYNNMVLVSNIFDSIVYFSTFSLQDWRVTNSAIFINKMSTNWLKFYYRSLVNEALVPLLKNENVMLNLTLCCEMHAISKNMVRLK